MGGCDFTNTAIGKDAREAFSKAIDQEAYENGHGGYTGTIAEKNSFQLFTLPVRCSTQKILEWVEVWNRLQSMDSEWDTPKEIKAAQRAWNKVPAQHRETVKRIARTYFDKWGPAVAFELRGKEAMIARKATGKRGKAFCFCGIASC